MIGPAPRNDPGYIMQLAAAIVDVQRQLTATITPITSNYVANTPGEVILANATAGAIVVSLPAVKDFYGKSILVKKTDASANAVTVTAQTGELIDGVNTKAVTAQYGWARVTSTGFAWIVS